MRLWESVVLATLVFALGAVSWKVPMSWVVVSVALVAAMVQASLEGVRWQCVPALVVLGGAVLAVVLGVMGISVPGWLRGAGVAFGVLGLMLTAVLALMFPMHFLPQPSGDEPIGTRATMVTDYARRESFTAEAGNARRLMLQVWYPADLAADGSMEPYLRDAGVFAAVSAMFGMPRFLMNYLTLARTHAYTDAEPAREGGPWPVVVFVSGNAGFRQSNTIMVEELVSHGYVVVGIDQPGTAGSVLFPDGRRVDYVTPEVARPLIDQSVEPRPEAPLLHGRAFPDGVIPFLSADVSFVLDELERWNAEGFLAGRLDLDRVGVMGVSLGGIVAADVCAAERRMVACLALDAPMTRRTLELGLDRPTMWLTRSPDDMAAEGWPPSVIERHATQRAAFASSRAEAWYAEVAGTFHMNFTDAPYGSPLFRWLGHDGPIGGDRAHLVVRGAALAFFRATLAASKESRRQGAAILDDPATANFPELRVERHG